MKSKLVCFLVTFILTGCYRGPDRSEYIGRYEFLNVSPPEIYGGDAIYKEFYLLNAKKLNGSFIKINEDGSFFLKNSLFKDSVGFWEADYNNENGGYLYLKFKNYPTSALFYYGEDGYKILYPSSNLFCEEQIFEQKQYQRTLGLTYVKK
ncbi:MAG: hypothetical protein J7604_13330 [Sporocytophaga sp.]|uniref:hypothetical protein n=1 Tax=Sporocytophaga sp. TaxID=2231183 RepID=UPI001B0E9AF6|nr:hypothetical protein [Sporocytophaga sp.]MBO9701185.1 hypothetical protein [Sporocytophaga sp.]